MDFICPVLLANKIKPQIASKALKVIGTITGMQNLLALRYEN